MATYSVYKDKSEFVNKIEQIESLMHELGISISVSLNANNGLVFQIGNNYATALCEGEPTYVFPRELDSRFFVSNVHGNPIIKDEEDE